MTGAERGFLLLTCPLGDTDRDVLTTAQFRTLFQRARYMERSLEERDLTTGDIAALGYGDAMASRIIRLLSQEDVLDHYLRRANRVNCRGISRIGECYPLKLRKRLGLDAPGSLWARGDINLLSEPMVGLVGSRDLHRENEAFAERLGMEAARQGYVLVSGNARGADRTAQNACLRAGGKVISVLADDLERYPEQENLLYLSEDGFDLPFTALRALSRNRVIHALADKTFVAQVTDGSGGTWDGTVKNLRFGWSAVYCFSDGSNGMNKLLQMGANAVHFEEIQDISALKPNNLNLFDQ